MLLFVLYFLIFQLAESAVNDRTVEVLNADAVNGVYAAGLFFTASGYLLFAFWYRRFGITARKGIFISSGAVYLLCVLMIHCTNQPVVFLLTAAGCLLAAGYIGGFSHYILAVTLRDGKYTGRVISIAIALGVVVQICCPKSIVSTCYPAGLDISNRFDDPDRPSSDRKR